MQKLTKPYKPTNQMTKNEPSPLIGRSDGFHRIHRRDLLKLAAVGTIALTAVSCKKETYNPGAPKLNDGITIDLKSDIGLLNFVFALEQLEAAFYSKVTENIPASFSVLQQAYLSEINLHEITHREFFKRYLGVAGIQKLEFDFSSIDFTSKDGVLSTAKAFKDLAVAAYNGVIVASSELATTVIAGQLSSIEARHAAWIRNQIVADSASDLNELNVLGAVAANGLDVLLRPAKVLDQVSKYIKTKLNIINI